MTAGHLVHVPRVAEIEGQINSFSMERWNAFEVEMNIGWSDSESESESETTEEISDDALWAMMEKHDSARKIVEQEIIDYDMKVHKDLIRKKRYQEKIAFGLSRISPASAFQLGAMTLAGTDINMKMRYEESMNNYRNDFYNFVQEKQKETGDNGHIMMAISIDEDGNQDVSTTGNRSDDNKLDLSELPRYAPPLTTLAESLSSVIIDFGLIALYTILSFMGAFIAFIRYDVR